MTEKLKFFSVRECCCSASHPKLVEIPKEGSTIYNNIVFLIQSLLDPIREKLGKPIIVTSGYRPKPLNDAVGGSKTSNHLYGCAADIHTGNNSTDNIKIVYAILELGIDYDEIIVEGSEFNKSGELVSAKWIHVAVKPTGNRKKFLYTTDFKNYYKLKKTTKITK